MKEWEKWKPACTLFLNPERKRMVKVKCPRCKKLPVDVQIRAERPPYLWRCLEGHVWQLTDGKAVLYSEKV